MFTFLLGTLGGLAFGSSYVLLKTPRSGKENQELVMKYIQDTTDNVENVSDKVTNFQQALSNLTTEMQNLGEQFVPEMTEIVEDFTVESDLHMRRITDGIEEVQSEIDDLSERIQ